MTMMRFIILENIPVGIIASRKAFAGPHPIPRLTRLTAVLDTRSSPSQLICQTPHKTEVSSPCGYELYLWCISGSSGVHATQRIQSLAGSSKLTLDHDDHVCNFLLEGFCHQFWYQSLRHQCCSRSRSTAFTRLFHTCDGRRQPHVPKECTPG